MAGTKSTTKIREAITECHGLITNVWWKCKEIPNLWYFLKIFRFCGTFFFFFFWKKFISLVKMAKIREDKFEHPHFACYTGEMQLSSACPPVPSCRNLFTHFACMTGERGADRFASSAFMLHRRRQVKGNSFHLLYRRNDVMLSEFILPV